MKNQEGNIQNRLFKKGRLHAGILETCRRILHEFHVFFFIYCTIAGSAAVARFTLTSFACVHVRIGIWHVKLHAMPLFMNSLFS